MTPRRFQQGFGLGRERERGERAIAALAGFILALLVGIGLYAFSSGTGPTIMRAPVDETWGQTLSP
jgi:hypothetical protein